MSISAQREIKAIPVLESHIGTDESGKGDYFGPLVIAGVFVNTRLENILKELGAADSNQYRTKKICCWRRI